MDIGGQVIQILSAQAKGDESIRRQEWASAVRSYSEATTTLMALPDSEPFDRTAFVASCLAGTATANIGLGNHSAALQCAEAALSFFNRAGGMYPAERGKWALATLSQGIASSALGRAGEAAQCRLRARQIMAGASGNLNFETEINRFAQTLDGMLGRDRMDAKAWWQFWK